jgi:hypothetical protein
MDDETRAALARLEAHMNGGFDALMTRLLEDAFVLRRRFNDVGDRLDRLERRADTP